MTARGICWSTSQNPTISDSHTSDGTGTGSFTSNITSLIASTTYYVRAYATNSVGTAYGEQQSFTTSTVSVDGQPCPNAATVTDVDGNVYNTVQIGQQCWMKENLRTTKYADGTSISLGSSASTTTAYRYYPNDSSSNVATYGYLYNWKAVMRNSSSSSANPSGVQGICPTGWHVPSDTEWTQLTNYVSSQSQYLCGSSSSYIAKALASTTGWFTYDYEACCVGNNPNTNNATGFSSVPAGYYGGSYYGFGYFAHFWSATQNGASYAYLRYLTYYNADVFSTNYYKTNGSSVRCLRDEGGSTTTLPTLNTTAVSNITQTSATCGGNVTSDGGATVTARGVCWSTSPNPTISDSRTTDGTGTGSFTSNITGLTANTTYYVRAYATNSVGTAYGEQQSFTTCAADGQPCSGAATLTDVDGNVYNTVQIGNQCWMKENLKTTKYADGTAISFGNHSGSSVSSYSPSWYYPNNNSSNKEIYGLLYNWQTAVRGQQGICPNGWHIPNDSEWSSLTNYISSKSQFCCNGASFDNAKALASTTGWNSSSNTCAVGNTQSNNNATGFNAFPAGSFQRRYDGYGDYACYCYEDNWSNFGSSAFFWSSTEVESYLNSLASNCLIQEGDVEVIHSSSNKNESLSVRCIKD